MRARGGVRFVDGAVCQLAGFFHEVQQHTNRLFVPRRVTRGAEHRVEVEIASLEQHLAAAAAAAAVVVVVVCVCVCVCVREGWSSGTGGGGPCGYLDASLLEHHDHLRRKAELLLDALPVEREQLEVDLVRGIDPHVGHLRHGRRGRGAAGPRRTRSVRVELALFGLGNAGL